MKAPMAQQSKDNGLLQTILKAITRKVAKLRQALRLIEREPDELTDEIEIGWSNTVRPWWGLRIYYK